MLIIISARAPFYNAVISSHLYPKYGIWGGGGLTEGRDVLLWRGEGGGGARKGKSLTAIEV